MKPIFERLIEVQMNIDRNNNQLYNAKHLKRSMTTSSVMMKSKSKPLEMQDDK